MDQDHFFHMLAAVIRMMVHCQKFPADLEAMTYWSELCGVDGSLYCKVRLVPWAQL